VRWVHGRGDKGVGRHQAHRMRKNIRRKVRAHGTHRADAIRPDVNRFFADATPPIGYEFLQCISNTTAGEKTLPIEVIPVASCYDNNRSQYLGGGLIGPVVVSSIQAMQSII